jgi:hypothetical protein
VYEVFSLSISGSTFVSFLVYNRFISNNVVLKAHSQCIMLDAVNVLLKDTSEKTMCLFHEQLRGEKKLTSRFQGMFRKPRTCIITIL